MSRRPRAPSEAVIEVRGLCNRFGTQSVHENLDLDLYKGEILRSEERRVGKECRL